MKISVRTLSSAALMTALLCLLSPLAIPVGMTNMTLQTFMIALAGYILNPRSALMAVCAYLLAGACGLPVFSGFTGGMGVLLGPTGGFLLAFPGVALLCASSLQNIRAARIGAGLAGLILLYAMGAAGLALSAGITFGQAVLAGVVPFVWKDVLSIFGAEWLSRVISKRTGRR